MNLFTKPKQEYGKQKPYSCFFKKIQMDNCLKILCMVLVVISLGCTPLNNNNEQPVFDAPMQPVPTDKAVNDWYIDQAEIAFLASMTGEHPNGLGILLQTLYAHRYDDYHSTFFVEDEFVAEVSVASGLLETRPFAVICLLDYRQIPCHPDVPEGYILELSRDSFLTTKVPLRIADLQPGMHDFNFIVVRDPYEEGVDATGEDIRYSTLTSMGSYNLLKSGVIEPAQTIAPILLESESRLEREAILDISPNPELVNELGNIPIWIEAQGKPGQPLPFYLHFNSGVHDEQGDVIAVTAFLNYKQIPILYEGKEYQSFFVERDANSWQRASVSVQLPDEPGIYELLVIARTDAFSPLEIERPDRDLVGSETSKRIRIEIVQ